MIPTSDYYVHFLASHREEFDKRYSFAMPRNELLTIFQDKATETRTITTTGVPIPRTIQELPPTASALLALMDLPIILKPRTDVDKKILKRKNFVANTCEDLTRLYEVLQGNLPRLIAQDCIPGSDDTHWVCDCVFNHRSELVAAFTFKKLSTSPPHFGVTSLGLSQRNEAVVELVRKLGAILGYVGPADVDFKYDARSQDYKYLEINPRVGMCNWFGTQCGVNAVIDAYYVAAGFPVSPRSYRQRDGVVYLDLNDDVHSKVSEGCRLPRVLLSYLSLAGHHIVGPYFSWIDPVPGIRVGLGHACKLFRRIRNRLWSSQTDVTPAASAQGL
jgi:predicted ATP-grasp superfamily ATP-dependent carboligase